MLGGGFIVLVITLPRETEETVVRIVADDDDDIAEEEEEEDAARPTGNEYPWIVVPKDPRTGIPGVGRFWCRVSFTCPSCFPCMPSLPGWVGLALAFPKAISYRSSFFSFFIDPFPPFSPDLSFDPLAVKPSCSLSLLFLFSLCS